jgi:transposase-like protein
MEATADLKKIYQADGIVEVEHELENFAAEWDVKYPTISEQ